MENKVKRVLQIGMSTTYGGTENYLMHTYRNIDRNKVQFDFINAFEDKLACDEEIRALGGNIYPLSLKRRDGLKKYKQNIIKFYKEYKFDAVQLNTQSIENLDMLKYAKKAGIKKRILYAHNSGFGIKVHLITKILHRINKLFVKSYATDYYAVGETAVKWIYPFWLRNKVKIIPNSIDEKKFAFNENYRNEIREKYNIGDGIVYGNIGRMDYQKNQLFLIKVFAKILENEPNSVLIIVGDGLLKEKLLSLSIKLNITKNIIFAGYQKETWKFYSAFDVFLYPAKFEGFGIVLLEAQSNGLNVVTSYNIPDSVVQTDLIQKLPLKRRVWIKKIKNCFFNRNIPCTKTIKYRTINLNEIYE